MLFLRKLKFRIFKGLLIPPSRDFLTSCRKGGSYILPLMIYRNPILRPKCAADVLLWILGDELSFCQELFFLVFLKLNWKFKS